MGSKNAFKEKKVRFGGQLNMVQFSILFSSRPFQVERRQTRENSLLQALEHPKMQQKKTSDLAVYARKKNLRCAIKNR